MIRALVATVCLLAAALVLGLALQVHAWQTRIADDDLRFQVSPLAKNLWAPPAGPGAGVARRLLAVGDDVAFRHAQQEFVHVHVGASDYAAETQRLAAFGRAQSTLEQLARRDPDPARRSRAANLLGILLWENAASAQDNASLLLQQSVDSFKRAVRASNGDDDAKYNLELLTTLLEPREQRRRDAPQSAGNGGVRGAGLAQGGKGY